jgi:hypothetical protein
MGADAVVGSRWGGQQVAGMHDCADAVESVVRQRHFWDGLMQRV